jgi:GntR family transcriptional regulator, N-acetylglucosamine utilization regulator
MKAMSKMKMLKRLDTTSPVPLYYQLVQMIKDLIERGDLKPGDTFWTEQELSHIYGVSRTTVRMATRQLAQEGLVVIKQGKRTYISKQKISRGFPGLTSFTEDMQKRGITPGSRLVAYNVLRPAPEVRDNLRLKGNEKAIQLKREMLADGEIIGFHIVYLPQELWLRLQITPSFLNNRSLYKALEEKGGIHLAEADETIEVSFADQETAKILGLKKGEPILMMNRLAFDVNGAPVEYAVNIYRADRYKYQIRHRRQPGFSKKA